MKDIIIDVLRDVCLNNNININTESARDLIADKLLETFEKKHIVFYTNLEKHNAEKNPTVERGL